MTNKKIEVPKVLDEISKSNSSKTGKKNKKLQRSGQRLLIVASLIFPLFLGLFYVGYLQWDSSSGLANLENVNADLTAQIENLESQFAEQNDQILRLQTSLSQQPSGEQDDGRLMEEISRLERLISDRTQFLNNVMAELENRLGSRNSSADSRWEFLEAEFLVRLANRKVLLDSDVNSAIFLLQSADIMLRDSGDSSAYATRQALANDLLVLKSVEEIDVQGIYVRLVNLAGSIESLSLTSSLRENYEIQLQKSITFESARDTPGVEQTSSNSDPDSAGILNSAVELFASIFVWRESDESLNRLLTPHQEYYVKENLHLMLEQTQLALLQGKQDLYVTSLQKSKAWLIQTISTEAGIGQQVASEIDALSELEIVAEKPDISQSLNLIHQLNVARKNNDETASDSSL